MADITPNNIRLERRKESIAIHAIEGIHFTDDEIAMMERMDQLQLSDEERIATIREYYLQREEVFREPE